MRNITHDIKLKLDEGIKNTMNLLMYRPYTAGNLTLKLYGSICGQLRDPLSGYAKVYQISSFKIKQHDKT